MRLVRYEGVYILSDIRKASENLTQVELCFQADPIFLPAAELLANNEDLLMAVYETNCTLVNNINIGETHPTQFTATGSLTETCSFGHKGWEKSTA